MRRGAGTLLIIVLVVVTSLFIMAMMQFFSASMTRGKRFLNHIAVTDYMCESALDEAVVWFKGQINSVGRKFSDPNLEKFHKEMVEGKLDEKNAVLFYQDFKTQERYRSCQPGLAVNVHPVKIWLDPYRKVSTGTSSDGEGATFDSEGAVNFTVSAECETTRKTATRSYDFRQVVVLPPQEFKNYAFVALEWNYLFNRLRQYDNDYKSLKDCLFQVARKIYFGLNMLWYIVEPDHAPDKSGSSGYMVGLAYARAVRDAAKKQGLEWGSGERLNTELSTYKDKFKNPNFSFDYLDSMSKATTSNLEKAIAELKTFGFQPSGSDQDLKPDQKYILSTDEQPSHKLVNSYGGANPIKDWGASGTFNPSGDAFMPANILFRRLERGTMDFKTAYDTRPVVVVPGKPGDTFDSSHLRFAFRPPPVFPPATPPASKTPDGLVDPVENAIAVQSVKDLESVETRLSDLAKRENCDEFKEVSADHASDYEMPGMVIAHPKTYYDWAFRLPPEDYKTNFKGRYDSFVTWRDATQKNVTKYKNDMEGMNAKLLKLIRVVDTHQPNTGSAKLSDAIANIAEAKRKASFILPTPEAFKQAMAEVRKAANVRDDTLVLNGVYVIDSGESSGMPLGGGEPLVIKETTFCGQGALVAGDIRIAGNLKGQQPEDNLLIWGTSSNKTFELNGDVSASVMTAATLKADGGTIEGCLVVKDTPCERAVKDWESGSDKPIEEQKYVERYYSKLPNFKVKYPARYADKKPYEFSHITFSTHRIASAGRRGR